MPKYLVKVQRITTETAELQVDAPDKDEAEDKVQQILHNPGPDDNPEWELEDTDHHTLEIDEEAE